MEEKEILEKVRRIVGDYLSLDPDSDVKPESDLFENLGADSDDRMLIMSEVTDEFEIDGPDETQIEQITAIQTIVDYVAKHL